MPRQQICTVHQHMHIQMPGLVGRNSDMLQSLLAPNLLHLSLHEMAASLQLALEELHICHSLGLGGCQVGSHVTCGRHEGSLVQHGSRGERAAQQTARLQLWFILGTLLKHST